jgi:Mn2+/Fe2+ NRAMP family transporter
MKSIAKITVFLMAVTALEASRLGSPRDVSDDSHVTSLTLCIVVIVVIVLFYRLANRLRIAVGLPLLILLLPTTGAPLTSIASFSTQTTSKIKSDVRSS